MRNTLTLTRYGYSFANAFMDIWLCTDGLAKAIGPIAAKVKSIKFTITLKKRKGARAFDLVRNPAFRGITRLARRTETYGVSVYSGQLREWLGKVFAYSTWSKYQRTETISGYTYNKLSVWISMEKAK